MCACAHVRVRVSVYLSVLASAQGLSRYTLCLQCLGMPACACVSVVDVYVHVYGHVHAYVCGHVRVHVCVYVCVCMCACMCVYVYVYAFVYACVYACGLYVLMRNTARLAVATRKIAVNHARCRRHLVLLRRSLHSLHLLLTLLCAHMPSPPQSWHTRLTLLCWQMLATLMLSACSLSEPESLRIYIYIHIYIVHSLTSTVGCRRSMWPLPSKRVTVVTEADVVAVA